MARDKNKNSMPIEPKPEPRYLWKYQKQHNGEMPPKDWKFRKPEK